MSQSYREINLQFYDALNQIFRINKHKTWEELAKEITIEKISEAYRIFGLLFPYTLNRYNLLPQNDPKEKLSSIFHGTLDGRTIINNVARYSLYCDEIIVFHPLQNPNNIKPQYDPRIEPNSWKKEFINALYFYIVLQKWVKAGIVNLIENPFKFDKQANDLFLDLAKERVASQNLLDDIESTEEFDEIFREKVLNSISPSLPHVLEKTIRKFYPLYTDQQIQQKIVDLKYQKNQNPLLTAFGDIDTEEDFILNMSGGNIEMIESLCKLTGSHSYTTEKFIKKQIELRGTNPFWTKFGVLYSGLNLPYLDNVDTSFALRLREEDRISGLRKALREVSSVIEQSELDNISDDKILLFNDKLKYEIQKSEQEWQKIIEDARKANLLGFVGSNIISLLVDPTKVIIPAISIPSSIMINEFFKKRNLTGYRQKDPYSVFVDLKNPPSFFSDLKNCVF